MKIGTAKNIQGSDLDSVDFVTTRAEDIENLIRLIADSITPIGTPLPFFGTVAPPNHVMLVGLILPTSDFRLLRNIYAPVFGESLSAGTFNTPDLRGKYLFGTDSSGVGSTLGGVFGSKGMAHFHGMGAGADLNILPSGLHAHNFTDPTSPNTGLVGPGFANTPNFAGYQAAALATAAQMHSHLSVDFDGRIGQVTGGQDGNTSLHPPSIAVNWITRYR